MTRRVSLALLILSCVQAFVIPPSSLLPSLPPSLLCLHVTTTTSSVDKSSSSSTAATTALWRDIARLTHAAAPASSTPSPLPCSPSSSYTILNDAIFPPTRLARLLSLQRQHQHAAVEAEMDNIHALARALFPSPNDYRQPRKTQANKDKGKGGGGRAGGRGGGGGGGSPSLLVASRKPPASEAEHLAAVALGLFLEMALTKKGPPFPPDSWCYSSLISCLLSVDKPHLALIILSKALHDGASLPPPSRPSNPPSPVPSLRPGLESGLKEVLASAVAALEEKGMDMLGDIVWREGRRKGWVEDCWSDVHPGVIDLHNRTLPVARAAVRHVYETALREWKEEDGREEGGKEGGKEGGRSPLVGMVRGGKEKGGVLEIITGQGEARSSSSPSPSPSSSSSSLSSPPPRLLTPAILSLLNQDFHPPQAARLKPKNPGRIIVPLSHVKAWLVFHCLTLDERKERLRRHIEEEGGKEGGTTFSPSSMVMRADGNSTTLSSLSPPPLSKKERKKEQTRRRITQAQSALVQAHIHRRPQHRAIILSLPPFLRQDWESLSVGNEGGRVEWKEKHVLVMEFCVEVGLTPKQLHAAVRRMTMKAKEEGVEDEGEKRKI